MYGTLRKMKPDLSERHLVETKANSLVELLDEIHIPRRQAAIVIVNEKLAGPEIALQDGDIIKIFPMLDGG